MHLPPPLSEVKNGFPNATGAADCMHITIKAPTDTEDAYT